MHSIRTKFIALILLSTITIAVSIGAVSFWNISQEESYTSTQYINSICRELAAELNNEIDTITLSVDSIADIAVDEAGSVDKVIDPDTRQDYVDTIRRILRNVAENTDNSVAYYFFVDPFLLDPSERTAGFLFNRQTPEDTYEPHELTDIRKFDRDDVAHTGWFYIPYDAGKPVWMEPYHNENLNLHAISYVVPLYIDDTFFAIVGMDIDFDAFTEPVKKVNVYETGYAYLMDDSGKVYDHPTLEEGTDTSDDLGDALEQFQAQDNGAELITYTSQSGREHKSAFSTLHNGMEAVVTADSKAIFARLDQVLQTIALILLLVSAALVAVTLIITRRITEPLLKLTAAADRIAQGDLDVELPEDTEDEVGTLTRSFRVTTQYLRRYISDINSLAYRDPLTDVKNKTAYDETVIALQKQMDNGFRDFAFVMLDANGLKSINDRYGHARGDEYLRNICQLICDVFKRSPVYRIGGDEFLVLLEKADYNQRRRLMGQLDQSMQARNQETDPAMRSSFAAGLSEARPEDRTVQEVFERADQNMYRRKKAMKENPDHSGR